MSRVSPGLSILCACLSASIALSCRAEPAGRQLVLLDLPPGAVIPTGVGSDRAGTQPPEVANPVADCLPGKMYDVRPYLEAFGVKLGKGDVALYNIDYKLLVVRAAAANAQLVKELFTAGCNLPPTNIVFDSEVIVRSDAKKEPVARTAWKMHSKSGSQVEASSSGSGISYTVTCQPSLGADGQAVDLLISYEIDLLGRKYSGTSDIATVIGRDYTFSVGKTPSGDKVEFRLHPNLEVMEVDDKADDAVNSPRWKVLFGCIEKKLKEREK